MVRDELVLSADGPQDALFRREHPIVLERLGYLIHLLHPPVCLWRHDRDHLVQIRAQHRRILQALLKLRHDSKVVRRSQRLRRKSRETFVDGGVAHFET